MSPASDPGPSSRDWISARREARFAGGLEAASAAAPEMDHLAMHLLEGIGFERAEMFDLVEGQFGVARDALLPIGEHEGERLYGLVQLGVGNDFDAGTERDELLNLDQGARPGQIAHGLLGHHPAQDSRAAHGVHLDLELTEFGLIAGHGE